MNPDSISASAVSSPPSLAAAANTAPADTAPTNATHALAAPPKSINPWPQLSLVSTGVSVQVPVVKLTVRQLFRLDKGSIIVTSQASGANAPLCVGAKVLAWGEFQVVGDNLALRIAELA